MQEDRPPSVLSPILTTAIDDFSEELAGLGTELTDPLQSFRSSIDELRPLLIRAKTNASVIPLTPTPELPLGADTLNQQFREAFVVSDKSERKAAIIRAVAEYYRIHSQAVAGAESFRPVHVALDNALGAANNFLNAVDSALDVFDAAAQAVAVALNAVRADVDTMLYISDKAKSLIRDVKEHLRPQRSEVVKIH
jgi:hypothetical protein